MFLIKRLELHWRVEQRAEKWMNDGVNITFDADDLLLTEKESIDVLWQQYYYVVKHTPSSSSIECVPQHTILSLCKAVLDHHTHSFLRLRFFLLLLLSFLIRGLIPSYVAQLSSTPMIVNHHRARNIVSARVRSYVRFHVHTQQGQLNN